ncbi:hypothetical protein K461DRAFT_73902 [Myriangium duriaei CBS 260.36]|uniref:Anaphase-promoting complex subunit 13 n=1 Tax=Myriangium duriaei CBS 260.36 TaxID=1168546 RepID=A0A9P4ISU1_9PEZI|nr:hypothetical protein K461DRAFT_73902 [Myriangium duriaei CBS 260.36]
MSRDSSHTYIHRHKSHHADLLEDFCRTTPGPDDILVPPEHQPLNPEDEDDVVPNEHAAFGIQRATQRKQEPAWRDLGLARIVTEGPPARGSATGRGTTGSRTIR